MQLRINERQVVSLYMNLRAEMARRNITISDIAKVLDVRYATVCDKINGHYRFYFDECYRIKTHFFPSCTLEYLFEREHEQNSA